MTTTPLRTRETAREEEAPAGPWRRATRRYLCDHTGVVGLIVVTLVVFTSVAAPLLALHDPNAQEIGHELAQPSSAHWMGTDEFGRDLLARVFHGGSASLKVGIFSVALATLAGTIVGLSSGYAGGWIESVLMRLMDALLVLPPVLWGVAVVAALGPGIGSLCLAVAFTNVPLFGRLVRASAMVEMEQDYIMGARSVGAGPVRILMHHILPNIISPLVVQMILAMAQAVQLEAALSFLGLGIQPPQPSWGVMLYSSRLYLHRAPWYAVAPGLMLVLLLAGLNAMSDAARRALDPRRLVDIA